MVEGDPSDFVDGKYIKEYTAPQNSDQGLR